jgi:hypothetical protein
MFIKCFPFVYINFNKGKCCSGSLNQPHLYFGRSRGDAYKITYENFTYIMLYNTKCIHCIYKHKMLLISFSASASLFVSVIHAVGGNVNKIFDNFRIQSSFPTEAVIISVQRDRETERIVRFRIL